MNTDGFYLDDAPRRKREEDEFGRRGFAERVAGIIAGRRDTSSLVIGLNAPWGEGKTTVLYFIEESLQSNEDIVCLRFNPWRFSDEATLLRDFFSLLMAKLDRSLKTGKEKLGDFVSRFAVLAAPTGQTELARGIGELLSTVELEDLRARVEAALGEAGKTVVVMMDDIDRLDKEEIYALFRLIKLTADFERVVYLLAFDDEMVATALGERYTAGHAENELRGAGRHFLEKIVQIPLHLPEIPRQRLRDFCLRLLEGALKSTSIALTEAQEREFGRAWQLGLEIRLRSPRQAKRYTNLLTFSLPLLSGEVNPVDVMLLEGIRVFFPSLYDFIPRHPDIFLYGANGNNRWTKPNETVLEQMREQIASTFVGLDSAEAEAGLTLLKLIFPQFGGIYGGTRDVPFATTENEQRLASPKYFSRYFSYSVPQDQIPDVRFAAFLGSLSSATAGEVTAQLATLLAEASEDSLALLNRRARFLNPKEARVLAQCLCTQGKFFTSRERPILGGSFTSLVRLLEDLVTRAELSDDERDDLLRLLMRESKPLEVAVHILRDLDWNTRKPTDDRDEDDIVVSPSTLSDLGIIFMARLREELNLDQQPDQHRFIGSLYPQDAGIILLEWEKLGDKAELRAYLENQLSATPDKIDVLLSSFVGNLYGVFDSAPFRKGDFEGQHYDMVARMLSPQVVIDTLKKRFGDWIATATYSEGEELKKRFSQAERLARQFSVIYRLRTPKTTGGEGSENK